MNVLFSNRKMFAGIKILKKDNSVKLMRIRSKREIATTTRIIMKMLLILVLVITITKIAMMLAK